MSILYLIAARNFISVNRDLIKKLGLEAAILLGELASEFEYYAKREELTDGAFYSTVANIEEHTGLSKYQQRQAFEVLTDNEIVQVTKRGMPAKRYIIINEEQVLELLKDKWCNNCTTSGAKIRPQVVQKLAVNNNIKKRINNENIQTILDTWNSIPDVPKIQKINDSREKHLTARINEYGIDAVIETLNKVKDSDFLRGKNDNGWVATFDWILKPSNFVKVSEGNYNKRTPKGKLQCIPSFDIDEIAERAINNDNYLEQLGLE